MSQKCPSIYLEIEELRLSLLEKQFTTNKQIILGQKGHYFKKWWYHQKDFIALNLYICTNVLVYERWLVLKVWYTSGQPNGSAIT